MSEANLCVCGHGFEAHQIRNGYCPLRLAEKYQPAGDLPRMALRPDAQGVVVQPGTRMDDIVVENPTMFRAEQMDVDTWWVCCYLANGEYITWHVTASARPKRLNWEVGELPAYTDIDAEREARTAQEEREARG